MANLIEMRNVAKSFGGLSVLTDVTLDVQEGARLGILGPNGAGKSTLFNLLSGLTPVTSGTIIYDGRNLTSMRPWNACRAGIGRTFQIPQPYGKMTVRDNLVVGLTNGVGLTVAEARKRADEVLEQLALSRFASDMAGELTLLRLKRLELARAIATRPRLLLLDEIAGGLTDAESQELLDVLGEVVPPETSVIWIEHVVSAVSRFVSEIAVLAEKRIIVRDTVDKVLANADVRRLYFGEETAA